MTDTGAKHISTFVEKMKSPLDRIKRGKDPLYANQVYCLHSFVPSENAKPDENGLYGFVKFRGVFPTQEEADDRAEYIVRHVDGFQDIYTSFCGHPFPLCADTGMYVKETNKVDIREHITRAINADIKKKVAKDKQTTDDMMERHEKLLEDEKADKIEDKYVTLQVKRANLVNVYVETKKSLDNYRDLILKCRAEIEDIDANEPHHRDTYMERYTAAREESGLDKSVDNTFLKYMGMDDTEVLGF